MPLNASRLRWLRFLFLKELSRAVGVTWPVPLHGQGFRPEREVAGYAPGPVTHNYKRHGQTTLYAYSN
jgi:hypothetical protein